MTDTTTEAELLSTAAGDADEGGKRNSNRKKRRLSKRERKNLKKQKYSSSSTAAADGVAFTKSSTSNNKRDHDHPQSSTAKDAAQHQESEAAEAPTLEEYMANYIPAPSVKIATQQHENNNSSSDSKSLGKWFPKASVIKSSVCYSNDYLAKLAKDKKKQQQQQKQQQLQQNTNSHNDTSTEIKEPKASLVLFYQYVNPTWSNAKVSSFLSYLTNIVSSHRTNIGGRIRVSSEGVNATVSAASFSTTNNTSNNSSSNSNPEFEAAQTLRHFTRDLQNFDSESFINTDFKYIDGLSADRHFKEMKLLPVKELVFYGIREEDCATATANVAAGNDNYDNKKKDEKGNEVQGGIHLDAKEYHEMLKRNDAVVIDVRNHYEAAIGRFDGQMETMSTQKKGEERDGGDDGGDDVDGNCGNSGKEEEGRGGGATYIDPKMRKSTDFTSWLAEDETKQKLEGKTVMMFCTGGIRCERASAYLNSQIGNKVNGVYQLKGGIERYLKEFPEGGFWRGKNFVFDKREAISAGNVNGDGGVVRKDASSSGKATAEEKKKMLEWGAECAKCKKPWDRYIGKRKCYTCGVPVLVCDACMSQSSSTKKKKKKGFTTAAGAGKEENNDQIRCPLCVAEGVTVPAEDVEWTDNGVRGRLRSSSFSEGGGEDSSKNKAAADSGKKQGEIKAAKSVLKWGGGHAKKKRDKRSWSRRPCQFGADCVRKDCFFYHPERESKNQKQS